jgi:hypothetical protein
MTLNGGRSRFSATVSAIFEKPLEDGQAPAVKGAGAFAL